MEDLEVGKIRSLPSRSKCKSDLETWPEKARAADEKGGPRCLKAYRMVVSFL